MSRLHGGWEDKAQPCLLGGSVVHPCPLALAWQPDIPASFAEDLKMSSTSLNILIACFPRGGGEDGEVLWVCR